MSARPKTDFSLVLALTLTLEISIRNGTQFNWTTIKSVIIIGLMGIIWYRADLLLSKLKSKLNLEISVLTLDFDRHFELEKPMNSYWFLIHLMITMFLSIVSKSCRCVTKQTLAVIRHRLIRFRVWMLKWMPHFNYNNYQWQKLNNYDWEFGRFKTT